MRINRKIFHAYDVRGIYPDEIDALIARQLGAGYAEFARRKFGAASPRIFVARDVRVSSEILRQGLIEGLIGAGADCIDLGITTEPQAIFAVATTKRAEAAIMITASHNPPQYNGFKFYLRGGIEIGLEGGLLEVAELAERPALVRKAVKNIGTLEYDPGEVVRYIKRLHQLMPKLEALRVVIDAAGGSAGFLLPRLLERYPIFYKPLNFQPDGTFRRHSPNPLNPAVADLMQRELTDGRYQLGVAFDGDGDRAIFFDELGRRIRNDVIFALLAAEDLERRKGSRFVFELVHSRVLGLFLEAYGGKLYQSPVGGVYIQKEMERRRARLGGELSGHIYHQELQNIDSGLYTMLRVFHLVAALHQPVSQVIQHLQASAFSQKSIPASRPQKILKIIERKYLPRIVSRLDGLTVQYPDWWFNIRASNTEPIVRLTIEAETEDVLKAHQREIESLINSL